MHKDFQKYWVSLRWRFFTLRSLSIALPIASAILILLSVQKMQGLSIPPEFWVVYLLSTVSLIFLWNSKLSWKSGSIISYLHEKYPKTEYSLSIFFKKKQNSLEQWQAEKVFQALPKVREVVFPFPFRMGFSLLVFSVLLYVASFIYQKSEYSKEPQLFPVAEHYVLEKDGQEERLQRMEYELRVNPPKYTGLASVRWKRGEKLAEGSQLVFRNLGEVGFKLIWQNQHDFNLAAGVSKRISLTQSSIYQISYENGDSLMLLKPEILEVVMDKAPILSTNLTENRYELEWNQLIQNFELDLKIWDDYGIASSEIVMTLSRGEGESVRFREMKKPLPGISGSQSEQKLHISLPLDTLGLQPGDELYFYFAAKDNKPTVPNAGRTDVYFLSIADTVESEPVAFEGFALNSEAEYFKSQRQIIIDTEKLLKDKRSISRVEFEERSNAIGADQKLLRLRYGRFLGEEFETNGGLGEMDHSGHDHGPVGSNEEHDHKHDDDEQKSEGNFSNPVFNETPELEAYVHAHNESELSTFLDAEVKAKLKEALANMWESELFLRTYRPQEALPYEYKALKLIKEVKRASRIYVERMGFEPPPLDEKKRRLTGELNKINAKTIRDRKEEKTFEETLIETYSDLKSIYQVQNLNEIDVVLTAFSQELVKEIVTEPVRYGTLLAFVKQFQSKPSRDELRSLLGVIEDMLHPKQMPAIGSGKKVRSDLHTIYYDLINE